MVTDSEGLSRGMFLGLLLPVGPHPIPAPWATT